MVRYNDIIKCAKEVIYINNQVDNLLDDFIDKKGFNLESFESYSKDLDFYLYKEIENGFLIIIFSNGGEELSQIKSFKDYAKSNNINFYLVNIILADEKNEFNNFKANNYSEILLMESGKKVFEDKIGESLFVEPRETKAQKRGFKDRIKSMPITLIIIVVNILVYIFTAILSKSFNIDIWVLIFSGAKVNEFIDNGQVYRFLTSAFLHGNFMHLFFNMYALFNIGGLIEKVIGKMGYLLIYFFSAFTSSFLSYKFNPYVSVGASGAIFGFLGALLIISLFGNRKINKGFLYNILGIIGINLFIGFVGRNIIDNFGHLGGLLGGLISTWIIVMLKRKKTNR